MVDECLSYTRWCYILQTFLTKYHSHLKIKQSLIEPRHDKTNIMDLRPAGIKSSLRIRAG
jgi:hypothetical protein